MQFVLVKKPSEGLEKAKDILYREVDQKTALFLSGGRTPKELYETLASEQKLQAGAVGLIDERYGEIGHENSNEKMIEFAGLLRYFTLQNIPFFPILQHASREETAKAYDIVVRDLLFKFPKSVGILGIGLDGHTAGIPSQNAIVKIQSLNFEGQEFVTSYNEETGKYGERITMTFIALSMLDRLIVIVLGKDKAHAMKKMFEQGSINEIPARFYQQQEISKKTILITDQKV